jgi:Asp/Glu/hydantoin racemase
MTENAKKYRFLLIQAFHLPPTSKHLHRPVEGAKETCLMNYEENKALLDNVEWELHRGPLVTYGDWPVETREEFALAAAGRLAIVREACESGKYNGIVLLGGGEPGFIESREIARPYGVAVTACGFSQMHFASMLGNRFSVIDLSEVHNMYYYDLVVKHRMEGRCASIRNINYPLPRPPHTGESQVHLAKNKVLRGESSEIMDAAVRESVAAIEDDGAEVLTFGCSALFWMRPILQKRLADLGWEVPVLEGYSCAITLAKAMVDMGVSASGLTYPGPHPQKWRRRKTF